VPQTGVEIGRHAIVLLLSDQARVPPVAHPAKHAHGAFLIG
jgi:hypothetical protein